MNNCDLHKQWLPLTSLFSDRLLVIKTLFAKE